MQENFNAIMDMIFLHEGGYVDNPSDPGGATNMGITFAVLKKWRGKDITKDDVKHMSKDEARAIYEENYWKPILGDDLPGGVDCSVMDFGVNSGTGRAVRMLQQIAGATPDGGMGPNTLKAVKVYVESHSTEMLIEEYADRREAYYRSLNTFPTFGRGWLRRNEETKAKSLELAKG